MKHTSRISLAVATAAAVVVPVAGASPAEAAGATGIYQNCTALHTKWKHGVGRKGAHDHTSGTPVTNFFHSTKAYKNAMRRNSRLDADKDGIACEAR